VQVFSCFAFTTIQFYKHEMTIDTIKDPNNRQESSSKEYGVSYYQACQVHSAAKLPVLQSVQLWTSQRRLPKESVTVVTQLSLDRYVDTVNISLLCGKHGKQWILMP
jgi:hypothetical protein